MILLLLACGKEPNPAPSYEAFCALVASMDGYDGGPVVALHCGGWVAEVCSESDGVLVTTEGRVEAARGVCYSAGYNAGGQGSGSCEGDTGAPIDVMYYDCYETVAR